MLQPLILTFTYTRVSYFILVLIGFLPKFVSLLFGLVLQIHTGPDGLPCGQLLFNRDPLWNLV